MLGTLAKIDKFHSSIALDEKLLKTESSEVKVSVLYFGLVIAYFSDETGTKEGYFFHPTIVGMNIVKLYLEHKLS